MKAISLLVSLFVSFPTLALAQLESVPFGGVSLKLQSSSSDKDPERLLVQVLTQTVKYLDSSFTSLLENTDVSFSHIGLSLDTYDVNPGNGENSVSFTFSGTAFFNSRPPPTTDDVLEMLAQSFLGKNSQKFTNTLMESKDPFLQRLSYAIVQVNGYVFPGGGLTESKLNSDEGEEDDSPFDFEQIALIAGAAFGMLLFIVLCYCFWCTGGDDQDDQGEPQGKPTITTTRTSDTADIEAELSPAPSSPQSIASQDSSVFTYNPQSRVSFDASTLSTNTADLNLDLATWQQRNVINSSRFAPFGHDISAIEMLNENKKDLSLIEEGDESATPIKSALSREYLAKRERRQRSRSRDISMRSEQSENSDVIADLRNLSQQINHHRRR